MTFLGLVSMESATNALKVSIIKTADPVKKKFSFAITDWQKASPTYCRMQKKASGFGFGQNTGGNLYFLQCLPYLKIFSIISQ